MTVAKIEIRAEYTSEDGWIYWVKIQKGRRRRWISLGGSDNVDAAFKYAKQAIGLRSIRL